MAILEIVEFPEKVLREPGQAVEKFDDRLEKLVRDLFETMYAAEGVGLAAQQVGSSLRLFVMDCEGIKLVAANPEIVSAEGEQYGDEACLSLAKVGAPLERAERVLLRAQDEHGKWFEREATGVAARCFLHETDHNDGKLFIDRLSPLKRDMVKKRFLKLKKWR
jgi:peptide deformylase